MPEEITLDLGEYGEIVVESAEGREEGGVRWISRSEVAIGGLGDHRGG